MKGIFGGSEVGRDGKGVMGAVGVIGVINASPVENDGEGNRAWEMERSRSSLMIEIDAVLTLLWRALRSVLGARCFPSVPFILAIAL